MMTTAVKNTPDDLSEGRIEFCQTTRRLFKTPYGTETGAEQDQ